MTGIYPVFMFGLPAVTLVIYRTVKPENRAKISGSLISMALTSFVTGVTEFSFMFLAPALYLVHAILTGLSMAVTYYCGVLSGGLTLGVIDYVEVVFEEIPALIVQIEKLSKKS